MLYSLFWYCLGVYRDTYCIMKCASQYVSYRQIYADTHPSYKSHGPHSKLLLQLYSKTLVTWCHIFQRIISYSWSVLKRLAFAWIKSHSSPFLPQCRIQVPDWLTGLTSNSRSVAACFVRAQNGRRNLRNNTRINNLGAWNTHTFTETFHWKCWLERTLVRVVWAHHMQHKVMKNVKQYSAKHRTVLIFSFAYWKF